MKKHKLSKIISVFTIAVFVIITAFSFYLTFKYLSVTPTEGSGLIVALIYVISSFHIIFQGLFNLLAYRFMPYLFSAKKNLRKRNILPFVIIILSVLSFLILIYLIK